MVERVLERAETWIRWDGEPFSVDDRVYTPHKAIRRVTDHLIDHLAQIDAIIAGVPTLPDRWHASASTTPSDLAPFTREDLDEAASRLRRLSQMWQIRVDAISPPRRRAPNGDAWSVDEITLHVAESWDYAAAVLVEV
jgi:hypothetical protein